MQTIVIIVYCHEWVRDFHEWNCKMLWDCFRIVDRSDSHDCADGMLSVDFENFLRNVLITFQSLILNSRIDWNSPKRKKETTVSCWIVIADSSLVQFCTDRPIVQTRFWMPQWEILLIKTPRKILSESLIFLQVIRWLIIFSVKDYLLRSGYFENKLSDYKLFPSCVCELC